MTDLVERSSGLERRGDVEPEFCPAGFDGGEIGGVPPDHGGHSALRNRLPSSLDPFEELGPSLDQVSERGVIGKVVLDEPTEGVD